MVNAYIKIEKEKENKTKKSYSKEPHVFILRPSLLF